MGKVWVLLGIALAITLLSTACGGSVRNDLRPVAEPAQELHQALAELDALSLPPGADAVVFASLKAALRELLTSRAQVRFTSAAPISPRSAVTDLSAEPAGDRACFAWSYRSEGDFNQDGVVSAADLVPLAVHFGKNSSAADWASASLADGNGDGTIEVSDVASIGANFRRQLTHYALERGASAAAAEWTELAQITPEAGTTDVGVPRSYGYWLNDATSGFYRVVACDGGERGACSNAVELAMPNVAPWPMFMHDARHTSCSPYVASQTGQVQWTFQTSGPGGYFSGMQVGEDGAVYIGATSELLAVNPDGSLRWRAAAEWPHERLARAADGTVYAINQCVVHQGLTAFNPDGTVKWQYSTGSIRSQEPAILSNGNVLVVTAAGSLLAITAAGELAWSLGGFEELMDGPVAGPGGVFYIAFNNGALGAYNSDGSVSWTAANMGYYAPAVGADGTLYCGGCGEMRALNPDGSLKWTCGVEASAKPCKAVLGPDGKIYTCTNSHVIHAIDADGTLAWSCVMPGWIVTLPAIDANGNVFIGDQAGLFTAISPQGSIAWTYATGDEIEYPAGIAADGTVYVASRDCRLYAFTPEGGKKWDFSAGGPVSTSAAVAADGTIYVSSEDHYLYALNADGSLRWSFETGGRLYSSPALDDQGNVFVGCPDGKLYAIDNGGSLKWTFDTGDRILASPVVDREGRIYIGNSDNDGLNNKLFALNPDGSLLWEHAAPGRINAAAALDADGKLYFNCIGNTSGGYIQALNADGSLWWSQWIAGYVSAAAASVNAASGFYLPCEGGLSAFNSAGEQDWRFAAEIATGCSVAVGVDGTLCFGDMDGICALQPDGSLKWRYDLSMPQSSSPALDAAGDVYIGSADHKVYALDANGTPLWTYATGAYITAPPAIGADGTVYIGSYDGKLYAFGD